MACRELDAAADKERVGHDKQGVGSVAHEGREGRLDLTRCAGVEDRNL
jgi:hypothetical protein